MGDTPIGVLLGADSLPGARSGIGRQTLEVARLLRQAPAISALALLVGERCEPADALETLARTVTPASTRGAVRSAAIIPGAAAVHAAWRRRQMNRIAAAMGQRVGGRVVYHEINLIARPFDGATVITVHDLSWRADPRWHTADRIAWIERRLPRTLAQASRVVCVSDFTACDVRRELGVAESRIDIVRPAASAIFRPMEREQAAAVLNRLDLTDRGYLFAVSTIEPRKNFDRLLAAHAILPEAVRQRFPLVVAGGRGWGEALADAGAERAIRAGTLRLLGHVADDDLVALYARSAAVAYVSLYEGFGLPVLEAMACGAPVIASRNTAVGETAGNAALLIDPEDVEDMASAIDRVLNDPPLAAALTTRGLQRAAEFSWNGMVQGLIASWRTALGLSDHEPGGYTQQTPE